MNRYTLIRIYYEKVYYGSLRKQENINCKILKEAIDLGSILTNKEKEESYILDNVNNKKLNLNGEYI